METDLKQLKQDTHFKDARRKNRWLSNRILTHLIDTTLDILDDFEEVCYKEEVALHTCMTMLRFLSKRKLAQSKLETYTRTCLSMSTKFYSQQYIPLLAKRDLRVEIQILDELKWEIAYPTPFNIRKYLDVQIPEEYKKWFNAILYLATRDPGYFDIQDKSTALVAAIFYIHQRIHPDLDPLEIERLPMVEEACRRLQANLEEARALIPTITNPYGGVQ